MNRIFINGNSSQDVDGLLIQELPPITKPAIRTQIEVIDGRDGDIVTPLGYQAYDKTAKIGLYGTYDIDKVIEFFNSSGEVVFSNEPDKYYNFQVLEQIDFERLLRFRTASVNFHVQPFKYDMVERTVEFGRNLLKIPQKEAEEKYGLSVSVGGGGVIAESFLIVKGTSTTQSSFYIPIEPLSLDGEYSLRVRAYGDGANGCQIALTDTVALEQNYFGGELIPLLDEMDETIQASASDTYNCIYIKVEPAIKMDFIISLVLTKSGEDNKVTLFNRGNYFSVPEITILGEGDITLSMHEEEACIIHLDEDGFITINGATMTATKGSFLANRMIECDFKNWYLPAGYSDISWEGYISNLYISDFSRWI